jgi:predicted transposase/invertase (TIGR01784 family)
VANKKHKRHDSIFRYIFNKVDSITGLLKKILEQDIQKDIDWATLEMVDGVAILGDLSQSHSDVVCKCQNMEHDDYYYFIVEHQSTLDLEFAFRAMQYKLNFCNEHVKEHKNKKYPKVLAFCIYASSKNSERMNLDLFDTFQDPSFAKEHLLRNRIVDLSLIPQEELLTYGYGDLGIILLKEDSNKDYHKWLEENSDLFVKLLNKGYSNTATTYMLTNDKRDEGDSLYKRMLEKCSQEQKTIIMNAGAALIQKGEFIGIKKGEAIGMQKGKLEGKLEIAKKMVKEGAGIKFIQTCTGLSVQEIESLSN